MYIYLEFDEYYKPRMQQFVFAPINKALEENLFHIYYLFRIKSFVRKYFN